MIYKIKFEYHYNNDEEWYLEPEVLVKAASPSEIENILKKKYSNGYIKILKIEEFYLNEGEILDITHCYGARG